jgi:hypothetical protein
VHVISADAQAEQLFSRIKHAVVERAAPAVLKATLVESLRCSAGLELCVKLCGKTDEDFKVMFSGGACGSSS